MFPDSFASPLTLCLLLAADFFSRRSREALPPQLPVALYNVENTSLGQGNDLLTAYIKNMLTMKNNWQQILLDIIDDVD